MGVIQVMDAHLSNMIAAGEVVDRPVNIVKECVENALDAGARSISVEVFEGGIKGLIITDDGCGMDEQDAVLAFARHATSKLYDEADLFNIQTMGFRGEALASIAAVAEVDMKTSNKGQGTHIHFSYGEMTEKEPVSCPRGTRIEVRGLFVRTPARFKYLKRAAYEFSIIAETMNKLAIAHPDIRFVLRHDGRMIFQTSGKGDKKEILYQMFGKETAMNALPFYGQSDDFEIEGYAVQPKINRAAKHFIYITINDRLVRSYPIVKAVIEGYHEYLPPDRYPIVLINVKVDPQLVDVNVHPNKLEVRLTKEEYLAQLIINTMENIFSSSLKTVEIEKVKKPAPVQQKIDLDYSRSKPEDRNLKMHDNTHQTIHHPDWIQNPPALADGQKKQGHSAVESNQKDTRIHRDSAAQTQDMSPAASLQGHPGLQSTRPSNFQETRNYIENHDVPLRPIVNEYKEQYGGRSPLSPSQLTGNTREKIYQNSDAAEMTEFRKEAETPETPSENLSSVIQSSASQDLTNEPAETGYSTSASENHIEDQQSEKREWLDYLEEGISLPQEADEKYGAGNSFFEDLKIIGQLKKSYILCENAEGLVIIDQHAAQERYHFEQLQKDFSRKVEVVQPLLVPMRIRVTPDVYAQIDAVNAQTEYYGLHFEPFSGNSFVLRSEPAWLARLDSKKFLEDMLTRFSMDGNIDIQHMNRHMIATAACHSSIRFNRTLCMEEMVQVIEDLKKCRQPYHCPHGRPTVITLSDTQMRKEFER